MYCSDHVKRRAETINYGIGFTMTGDKCIHSNGCISNNPWEIVSEN
jgi:hypothetical protein